MPADTDLSTELGALERQWKRVTEVPETPRSLLQVIEFSLGSQRKAEEYVNRVLRYLLHPREPHGMEAEFLRAFLDGLPEDCSFQEDTYDLSDVQVDDQVRIVGDVDVDRTDASEKTGYVDLVVESPNEWFLLIELKFRAGENNFRGEGLSQTEYYHTAERIEGTRKDDYEAGHYYLYLHHRDEPAANEPEFANWTWEEFTTDVLTEFLAENAPRYPQRTTGQLRDLVDDVQEIADMTEHHANRRRKIDLYLDHYEAIEDVRTTFDDRWTEFAAEWPARLADRLAAAGIPPDGWHFDTYRSDWGHLFRDGWWRAQRTLESIDDRIDGSELRVSFVHRLRANQDEAIRDETLVLVFRNAGANDQAFIDAFTRNFENRREEIERLLPEAAEVTGNKRNLIEARYDIPVAGSDDFFDAYLAALQQGFVDLALENEPFVETLTDAYEDSIAIYRDG